MTPRHSDFRSASQAPVALTQVKAGRWVRVAALDGCPESSHRLADMGLLVGGRVRMVRPSSRGPVLVEVKGSRLALGHGMAAKILVHVLDAIVTPAQPAVAPA